MFRHHHVPRKRLLRWAQDEFCWWAVLSERTREWYILWSFIILMIFRRQVSFWFFYFHSFSFRSYLFLSLTPTHTRWWEITEMSLTAVCCLKKATRIILSVCALSVFHRVPSLYLSLCAFLSPLISFSFAHYSFPFFFFLDHPFSTLSAWVRDRVCMWVGVKHSNCIRGMFLQCFKFSKRQKLEDFSFCHYDHYRTGKTQNFHQPINIFQHCNSNVLTAEGKAVKLASDSPLRYHVYKYQGIEAQLRNYNGRKKLFLPAAGALRD